MICSQCNKEFIKSSGSRKYCSDECRKLNRKLYLKNYLKIYNLTDKGIEKRKKWQQSKEGREYQKEYIKEYKQTDRGKEVQRKADKKHSQTDKGKATVKKSNTKYNQTDKGKKKRKEYRQTDKFIETQNIYRLSDRGKEIRRKGEIKYNQSDKGKKTRKNYRQSDEGRKKYNNWEREKLKSDPIYKLTNIVRARLRDFLKSTNMRKTNKTFKMVGCTPEFLKKYIEKKFKPGMTWKNHSLKGWHIDHVKPLSKAKTPKDVETLMYYTNLQPLWAIDNMKKGDKY